MKNIFLIVGVLISLHCFAQVPVTGISFNSTSVVLKVNNTLQLIPVFTPSNATNQTITYSSNKTNVTVSSTGLLTGVDVGIAIITATTLDGNFKGTVAVNLYTNNLTLPSIIASNMVLQQDVQANLWGWGPPNGIVSITASWGQTVSTRADVNGRWSTTIQTPNAVQGATQTKHTLTFVGLANTITLTNILIGDVYLCAGQSNMAFTMQPSLPWTLGVPNYATEIAAANYPNIRTNVPWNGSTKYAPSEMNQSTWSVCTPTSIANFSAVAYYFAKEINNNLNINIPIGVIVEAVGGSACQAWIRREALSVDPVLKSTVLDPYDLSPNLTVSTASSVLYNGMIAPIVPFSLKGFLWYQGEANNYAAVYSTIYTKLNTALIKDWRTLWGQGNLPFLYVQLPANNSLPPELRDQQSNLLTLPNTGMAITMDLGGADLSNIHPQDKKDVGKRLALLAEAKIYGQNITYTGPTIKSMKVEGAKIRITYHPASIGRGLASRDGFALNNFKIAESNNIYYNATAVIDGNDVLVSSSSVTLPTNIAFAYVNTAVPNLMNKDSLTACPFRTDTWNYTITIDPIIQSAVEEVQSSRSISIFPIPATDNLNINFTEPMNAVFVQCVDLTGKSFYKASLGSNVQNERINLSGIPKGYYIVQIRSKNLFFNKQFLIQ